VKKLDGWELERRIKRMRVPDLLTLRKARDLRNSESWLLSDQDKTAIKADILRQKSIPILHAQTFHPIPPVINPRCN
jgi:hypothetical protein